MKVLSLFDGISCARVALERAGIPVHHYYASEIDKYAIQISKKNYPDIEHIGSVVDVKKNMPSARFCRDIRYSFNSIDLLIGGSPCQDLSIAKKDRKGLSGERSGLFWEYVRILNEVKPKWFILENVASMPKEAKELITKTLGVEPIMIDAALVSAQRRKRLFWTNIPNVTLPIDRQIFVRDILQPENEVDKKYYIKQKTLDTIWKKMTSGQPIAQAFRIYDIDGKSVSLSALGGGTGAKTGLYLIVPEATKKGYALAADGDSVDLSFPTSKTRRGRVGDKVKNLMTSQNICVYREGQVRKLTPKECERLQSLPDLYTSVIDNDSQRYKTLGNAFNVDVVAHILSFISK